MTAPKMKEITEQALKDDSCIEDILKQIQIRANGGFFTYIIPFLSDAQNKALKRKEYNINTIRCSQNIE